MEERLEGFPVGLILICEAIFSTSFIFFRCSSSENCCSDSYIISAILRAAFLCFESVFMAANISVARNFSVREIIKLRVMVSGCAAGAFNFWKIEPEVAAVIVLTEDEFTVGAGDRVTELVAIAAVLENGGGDAEIGDTA